MIHISLDNGLYVKTVTLLSKLKPDDTIEIKADLDELDATAAETKATYPEIKEYILEKSNGNNSCESEKSRSEERKTESAGRDHPTHQ